MKKLWLSLFLFLATPAFAQTTWSPHTAGANGVNGPALSTDNAFVRFDGVTGKLVQNSTATLGDTGAVTGFSTVSQSGLTTWSAGLAITANAYQVGRDADATNQLHFNAPGGTTMEFSLNDVPKILFGDAVAGNVLNVSCTTTTTGFCINSNDGNALTTGAIARFVSNSADTSGRNLVFIRNQNTLATGTTALTVQQDAANPTAVFTQTANGGDIVVNSSATSNNALRFLTTAQTTAAIISIPSADSLTTGNALNFVSNSADTSTRSLAFIRNQNALATGATGLQVQNDSTNNALRLDSTADGTAMSINSAASTKPGINFSQSTQTTGNIIGVTLANSLTTGTIEKLQSNSADVSTRALVDLQNNNTLATGATPLKITQAAAQNGETILENGNGTGLQISTTASTTSANSLNLSPSNQTTGAVLNIPLADSLTTGQIVNLASNSTDTSARNLWQIQNSNALATGAVAMSVTQSSTNTAANFTRGAVSSANALVNLNDAGTGGGMTLNLAKTGGAYTTGTGILTVNRSGSFTGVNGETSIDSNINPSYTMTEPGAGSFNDYGMNIDMTGVAVTAGAGTSVVAALNVKAGTDTDAGNNYSIQASGTMKLSSGFLQYGAQIVNVADNAVGATPATSTITPTSGVVQITCNDPDGCNITMAEPAGIDGSSIKLFNMGTNTVNFADTAGVTELAAGFAAGQYDSIGMTYNVDRWIEDFRSNN